MIRGRAPISVGALFLASVALAGCHWDDAKAGRAAALEAKLPFTITRVARFERPFALAFLPGGGALVTERGGYLKLLRPGGEPVDVAGIPPVAEGGQHGLLDIAPAPDFAASHAIYFTYTEPRSYGSSLALARATLDTAGSPHLVNLRVIWRAGSDGDRGQFGAQIAFAPDRQSLFVASGERQRLLPAQDPNQALGKILHLTLDGRPAPDNPLAEKLGAQTITVTDPVATIVEAKTVRSWQEKLDGPNLVPAETWSTGHRNPYGLAFAPDGRLWEHEMGPQGGDELNLILPGRNYGWPRASDGSYYDGSDIPDHTPGDGFAPPVVNWTPAIAPSGMLIYSANLFPGWKGSMLIGAMGKMALIRIALDGAKAHEAERWAVGFRIRDLAQAPDGSIWLLEDGPGAWLMKLTPRV